MPVQNEQLFITAFQTITTDPELGPSERLILLAVASLLRSQDEIIWASIEETLAELTGLSGRSVSRTINGKPGKPGLAERGYLHVDNRGVDPKTGKHRPNGYQLNWKLLGLDPRDNLSCGPQDNLSRDIYGDMEVGEGKTPDNVVPLNTSSKYSSMSQDKMSRGPQDILSRGDDVSLLLGLSKFASSTLNTAQGEH